MLRPLGLGEILDRAVTLCVRHFALFALIFVVYAVPIAIFQFFGTADQAKFFGSLTDVVQAQAAGKHVDPNAITKALSQTPAVLNVWTGLLILALVFVSPLPTAAMIEAASELYLGGASSFERAYRTALDRWLPLIGVNLLYIAAGIGLYIVIFIVALIFVFAIVLVAKASTPLGVAMGIVFGGIFLLAALAFGVIATLAIQISYFGCVVERQPFVTAFSRGISRVFGGTGLRRSLIAGLAYVAVLMGIGLVSLVGQSLLYGFLKSNVAGTIYETIVRVATAAFTTAFVAIFYYDLRVRTEGLDLHVAAGGESLPAS